MHIVILYPTSYGYPSILALMAIVVILPVLITGFV